MITIGRMAEKFHLLPHEVEARATTYDFMIMDVLATYDRYQDAKSRGLPDASVYNFKQDELQEMVNKTKTQ